MNRINCPEEWEAFKENARRFDNEVPERRYGILNPSANPPLKEEDMLYAADPRTLHDLHYDNYPSILLRKHLDNMEIMDGKKPKYFSSFI